MTTTVVSVLGGFKELGQRIVRRVDFDALIKKGIPLRVLVHLKRELDLPDEVIARIIGVSPRTLARMWTGVKTTAKAGQAEKQRLSPMESDRVYRFAKVIALAEDVFEDRKEAIEWLNSAQSGLGGRIPFDMLLTDAGSSEVEELLIRIDYGVIS